MPFMYLHLFAGHDGKLRAEIKNHGSFNTLGTGSSQMSQAPSAVFRLEAFLGIECIEERDLLNELMKRYTTKELMRRFSLEFSDQELLDMLRERLRD